MLRLDDGRFAKHFSEFVALAGAGAGLDAYVASLEAKHRLFAGALAAKQRLDLDTAAALLEAVFTARRKLFPLIEALGADEFGELATGLVRGTAPLGERLEAFCDALPYPEGAGREARAVRRKLRGAALDFAAELLHFADPLAHPLMTRWVWDASTSSGALRELMEVPDSVARIDLEATPETFGAARAWLVGHLAEQGVYRDQHWLADLTLAMAYVSYFRAMTGGALGSDFMRASTPEDQLRKLLGIDAERRGGRSRVRRATALH
jgi:hypothetical protein